MPALSAHQSGSTTKLLFVGDSGAGKTGALASLAAAGYNLRIIDLDNGLDVLANILSDPQSKYGPEALSRVNYVTITDKMRNSGGKLMPSSATVWTRTMQLMQSWKDGEIDFGPVTSWTSNEVLVIDSLTMLSNAALDFALSLQGRLGQHPQLQDWGVAQNLIESFIKMLYDDAVKCNVIVNCHIKYMGEDNGPQRGYPNTLGKALPPIVGRYFNSILLAQSSGTGSALKRQIWTTPRGVVELKNTAPTRVAVSYPLETGLADYFKAVRG
jgi:AAA domain